MDIQEFVSTVLIDIVRGLNIAGEELSKSDSGAVLNPMLSQEGWAETRKGHQGSRRIQQVEMSIAVTVSDSSGEGGKVGISVAGFSAELNSAKSSTSNSSISTVKFTVPIAFPVGQ